MSYIECPTCGGAGKVDRFTYGSLTLIEEAQVVERYGRKVQLAPQEYHVLEYLVYNRHRMLSAATIYRACWFREPEGSNTLSVVISELRKKLGRDLIRSRRGLGYELREGE